MPPAVPCPVETVNWNAVPHRWLRVLASTGGRQARTAEILEISRPRLARMIEEYGLE
jgi:hypothetical protein